MKNLQQKPDLDTSFNVLGHSCCNNALCSNNCCKKESVTKTSTDEPRNRFERRHPDLSALLREMPPFVSRNHPRFKELTGYTGRTFANMDCLGQTEDIKKIMLGNTVAYERESLVHWLEERSFVIG